MKRSVAIGVVALLAWGCARHSAVTALPATPPVAATHSATLALFDARALAVYRTVADSVYVRATQRTIAILSAPLDTACAGRDCAPIGERWGIDALVWNGADAEEMASVRRSWLNRNGASFDLRRVPFGWPNLVTVEPMNFPGRDGDLRDWVSFRDANGYAVGAVRFSPVGFGQSGKTALVSVEWRCGPTCGHSLSAALVATSDSTWRIDDMVLVASLQHQ